MGICLYNMCAVWVGFPPVATPDFHIFNSRQREKQRQFIALSRWIVPTIGSDPELRSHKPCAVRTAHHHLAPPHTHTHTYPPGPPRHRGAGGEGFLLENWNRGPLAVGPMAQLLAVPIDLDNELILFDLSEDGRILDLRVIGKPQCLAEDYGYPVVILEGQVDCAGAIRFHVGGDDVEVRVVWLHQELLLPRRIL